MIINADQANPTITMANEVVRKIPGVKTYAAPLIVHAKKKSGLKTFFSRHPRSSCDGQGVGVAVFIGRYHQGRMSTAKNSIRKDSDWLGDIMLQKYGIPGLTEAMTEIMMERRKFVLITVKTHLKDPKLFRNQLSITRLHESKYPQTSIAFNQVGLLLSGNAGQRRTGAQWRAIMGFAPEPRSEWYEDHIAAQFELDSIEL